MITHEISRATPEDLPEIIAIEQLCFSDPWSSNSLLDEINLPRSCCLVIRENQAMVGYAMLRQILNEGHIMNIAIHPEYQNHGIGTLLMGELLKQADTNGIVSIFLEVRISNKPAVQMYQKLGFELISTRKNYYTHPCEDALVMVRETSLS